MAKDNVLYDYTNKTTNVLHYRYQILNKILTMFKYHGLPVTIPQRNLELQLIQNGYSCIAEYNNNLYAFYGGLGGEPNVYNEPTICTVANSALNLSKEFTIDRDCVIMRNDSMLLGMLPTVNRYATELTENDISTIVAMINSRITTIFSTGDNQTKESAIQYLHDISIGRLGVVSDNTFIESLKVNPVGQKTQLFSELIQINQYLKACLNNDIGLQANTQLKKERLVSAEVETSSEGVYPIVDDMINQRREALEKINAMFGTNISVEFTSSWDYRPYNGASVHNVAEEVILDEGGKYGNNDETTISASNEEQNTDDEQKTNGEQKSDEVQKSDEQKSDETEKLDKVEENE